MKKCYTKSHDSDDLICRFVGAVSDLVLPWAGASPEGRSLCNHRRAYKFFTDSVSPKCHFPAFPCSDYDAFMEVTIIIMQGTEKSYINLKVRNQSNAGNMTH